MSYFDEFQRLAEEEKLGPFFKVWEEYCMSDEVDADELILVLNLIKTSAFAPTFGQFAETALPLWQQVQDKEKANLILALILDLQSTNSPVLADLATDFVKTHYANDKYLNEKMRIVGLRARSSFQGAISNFQLLTHMKKGSFVFHTGGWGVGEVMDISILREHVLIEFEGVSALKELSFENAFKNLTPLPSDHFLSRRFGDADALEQFGKEEPVELVRLLLRDLGPKTASQMKEELSMLVIPEEDWAKWWQQARAKLKKDTKIQSPKVAKEPFCLRDEALGHDVRFLNAMDGATTCDKLIGVIYKFTRDFPEILKNAEVASGILERLKSTEVEAADAPHLTAARQIQIAFFLEDILGEKEKVVALVKEQENFDALLDYVDIVAFKKRILSVVLKNREDWAKIFLHLLFVIPQNTIRDYIFKELSAKEGTQPLLKERLEELQHKMTLYPDAFFWYFQKILASDEIPLSDRANRYRFLEAFFILMHYVENKAEERDLVKKMYQVMTAKRYQVFRLLIEGAHVDYLEEVLLLGSKCHTFTKHDLRIFRALAEVVQPSMATGKESKVEEDIVWTTKEGYTKLQERINQLGTVETVENAREIEAARALGDLRENSEYKFALERRSRIQGELKMLSDQINMARILTPLDVDISTVNVGTVATLKTKKGEKIIYTLLGPWDADPEKNILSFQSKLAQAMIGCKVGDPFSFQGETFTVEKIHSYLGT